MALADCKDNPVVKKLLDEADQQVETCKTLVSSKACGQTVMKEAQVLQSCVKEQGAKGCDACIRTFTTKLQGCKGVEGVVESTASALNKTCANLKWSQADAQKHLQEAAERLQNTTAAAQQARDNLQQQGAAGMGSALAAQNQASAALSRAQTRSAVIKQQAINYVSDSQDQASLDAAGVVNDMNNQMAPVTQDAEESQQALAAVISSMAQDTQGNLGAGCPSRWHGRQRQGCSDRSTVTSGWRQKCCRVGA